MRLLLAATFLATVLLPPAAVIYGQDATARVAQVEANAFPSVDLYVSVLDPSGAPITGLAPPAFTVLNGRVVPFELRGDSQGMSVMLVLDRSGSMAEAGKLPAAKQALHTFAGSMKPADRVGLISFSNAVTLDQPLSPDKTGLLDRVDQIRADGGTALFDAAARALDVVRPISGRRAIVLLTDGVDNQSSVSVERVVDQARQDKINLFTLGLGTRPNRFLGISFGGDLDESVLQRLATASDGEYFYAPNAGTLASLYSRIAQQLGSEYVLRYQSPRAVQDGTRRDVEVRVALAGTSTLSAKNSYVVGGVLGSTGVNWAAFAAMLLVLAGLLHPAGVPALLEQRRRLRWNVGAVKLPRLTFQRPKAGFQLPRVNLQPPNLMGGKAAPSPRPENASARANRARAREIVIDHWPFLVGGGPSDDVLIMGGQMSESVAQFEEFGVRLVVRVLKPGTPVRVSVNGRQEQWRAISDANALVDGSLISVDNQVFSVRAAPWRVVRQ